MISTGNGSGSHINESEDDRHSWQRCRVLPGRQSPRGRRKVKEPWLPGGQIWTEGGGGVPLVRAETKEVASVSREKQQHAPGLISFSAAGHIV